MMKKKEKTNSRINTRNFFSALEVLLDEQKQLEVDITKLDKIMEKIKPLRNNTLKINEKLSGMQKQLSKAVSKTLSETNGRKVYVDRCDNEYGLLESIHRAMKPNKRMKMKDILSSLKRMGYKTNTSDKEFYTMVNTKLNKDHKSGNEDKVTKLRRGVFVYKYRPPANPKKKLNSRKKRVLQAAVA